MTRYFYFLVLVFLVLGGCFNAQIEEPLVVLGNDTEASSDPDVRDPRPGVSDDQLTSEQRQQRSLARCQMELKIKKKKIDELDDKRDDDKKRYKRQIEELKDEIDDLEERTEDLEKENRKLRKKLYDD